MEEEDNIIVKWAQEDVETSYSLLNNINNVEAQKSCVTKICLVAPNVFTMNY